jgi:hypothetical protein
MAYSGKKPLGEQIARRMIDAIVLKDGVGWEMPNILDASGKVIHGDDFYQMTILWALPLAFAGEGIHEACAPGGFIRRILDAARPKSAPAAGTVHA